MRPRGWRALVLVASLPLSGCDGCGGAGRYPTRDATPEVAQETGSVAVSGGFDLCPTALMQVSPSMVKLGQPITLVGSASAPDGGLPTFVWKAGSGTFADPSAAETTFQCAQAGPVTITLTVSDGACATDQSASVFCLATGDGGVTAGGASGSGGGGGAGGGGGTGGVAPNSCPGAEPTSGGATCPACTTDNCSLGAAGTDGCCGLSALADQVLCEAAAACFAAHACTTAGDPTVCFCGTASSPTPCFSIAGAANGPCAAEVRAAARSSDPASIKSLFVSSASALGRAVNLTGCRGSFCTVECAIP